MIAGGRNVRNGPASKAVYMIEWATGKWTRLPSMINHRIDLVCGMVKNTAGEPELIVVGGAGTYRPMVILLVFSTSVDLYSG